MTNPITKLSDLFSKLIIEHGSAVIQEKHIALLKEQFSLLEKENLSLKSENGIFKTETANLKQKIINLEEQIKAYHKSNHDITLNNDEIKVLCFLAEQKSDDVSLDQISNFTGMSLQVIQFHLDNLKIKKMVGSRKIAPFDDSTRRYWFLEHRGRQYLIENKIIT